MDLTFDEDSAWTENNDRVICWMTKDWEKMKRFLLEIYDKKYFHFITARKYNKIGIVYIVRLSKIAAFVVPPLIQEREKAREKATEGDYSLGRTLLMDNKDLEWRVAVRDWCNAESETIDTDKGIEFLSKLYKGTFTE